MSTLILPRPSTQPDLYFGKYVASGFSQSEPGHWYDAAFPSTMYQDAYGRVPVTNYLQPVGLVMDARRAEIFKITKADLLDTKKWVGVGGPSASQNPDGSIRITRNTTDQYCGFVPRTQSYLLPPGCAVRAKVSFTASTTGFRFSGEPYFNWRDVNPGFLAWVIPAGSVINENMVGVNLTGGSLSSNMNMSPTLFGFYMSTNAGDQKSSSDYIDVLDFEITAYHPPVRQVSAPSRPIFRFDSRGQNLLDFDGIDDGLSSGIVDFSSTNKVTIFAGVRKRSDSSVGFIAELSESSISNVGAFGLSVAPGAYGFRSRGTANADTGANVAAPSSNVLTCIGDISAPLSLIRNNGVLGGANYAGQGSGNYGKHRLHIGRRAGTTFPFNGNLYALISRGARSDDMHIKNVESYLAYRTGVAL